MDNIPVLIYDIMNAAAMNAAIQALIYVNIAIWLGIGGYCFFLAKKQSEMDKRLNTLITQNQTEK